MFNDKSKRDIVACKKLQTTTWSCFLAASHAVGLLFNRRCQGDKLADILREAGGSLEAMELRVKHYVSEEESNKVKGGWHTDISMKALGWSESSP